MKSFQSILLACIGIFFLLYNINFSIHESLACTLFCFYFLRLFINIDKHLSFKELIMVLFSLNYLLAPALIYYMKSQREDYSVMQIEENRYFELSIPAMFFLNWGLYFFKASKLGLNINKIKTELEPNKKLLIQWFTFSVFITLIRGKLPGELAFYAYLIGLTRFVTSFGLLLINRKRNFIYIIITYSIMFYDSLAIGIFNDLVIWVILLGILMAYLYKPKFYLKLIFLIFALLLIYLIQITKGDYRSQIWYDNKEASISVLAGSIDQNIAGNGSLFSESNLIHSLSRVNQGWIFASTVNNMDKKNDFQGFSLLKTYIESALLPRFLDPNKLTSDDQTLFNRFSGKFILKGTSMGLGILADGYISFESYGVYFFALLLGLLFYFTFWVAEIWNKNSPFLILFIFPILSYSIRPDCSTQTVLGHIFKSILLYSVLIYLYNKKRVKNQNFIDTI